VKNLSLILNAILFVAIGVLYYLHFSSKAEVAQPLVEQLAAPKEETIELDTAMIADLSQIAAKEMDGKIAYVNLEEFFEKYEFYKQGVRNIERSIESKRKKLMDKQKVLEEDFQKYQQAAPTLSDTYRKTKEQQLMEQEQELFTLRDQLQEEQQNEFSRFNESLLKKVDDYLKNLSKEKNFNFVFTYSKGNPATIVFARDSLDITKMVVDGLNKEYRKK
jgi:outer membrane protein